MVEDIVVILSGWLTFKGQRFVCSPILQLQLGEGLNRKQDVTGSQDYAGSVYGGMCWHDMGCALYAATGARGSFFCFFCFILRAGTRRRRRLRRITEVRWLDR